MPVGTRRAPSDLAFCAALVVVTLLAYARVAGLGFVAFDDDRYVLRNEHVTEGLTARGIAWAFTTGYESNWHPVTWLSHMTDVTLFGLDPAGPHLVNLALHAASVALLFLALRRMTAPPWPSAAVAALFALHPLHVESVAWVAERKDVLSGLFAMLTLLAYARWVGRGGRGTPWGAVAFLAVGLMAKPMLVTLPFVLLLLDSWPLRRPLGARRVVEKAPLLALAALSSIVTFLAQQAGGAVKPLREVPLDLRLANAAIGCVRYLSKTVWPSDLAVFYPYPTAPYSAAEVSGAVALLLVVSAAVTIARRRGYLPVGWAWFLGMLVPVIGIVQVGNQALADRYTYLPHIGLFLIAAWGTSDIVARWPALRTVAAVMTAIALVALGVATWRQVGVWKSSETLFSHAIAVTGPNAEMHYNLGTVLGASGREGEALEHYRRAVAIDPRHVQARVNLANLLLAEGRLAEAAAQYAEAVRIDPLFEVAVSNLAATLVKLGRPDEAMERYRELLRRDPASVAGQVGLANLLFAAGHLDEAASHYAEAVRIDPSQATAHYNLAAIRAQQGRLREAVEHYEAVLRLQPGDAEARANLEKARRDLAGGLH